MNKVNSFVKVGFYTRMLAVIPLVLLTMGACSAETTRTGQTLISGIVSISSQVGEDQPDYSGVRFVILSGSPESGRDTLLNAVTNTDGFFSSVVPVPERGLYPLIVSRNDRTVHIGSLILAPDDTVSITGELPGLDQNLRVNSPENRAMATYERLQRLYGRVATFAYGGSVENDSIPILMEQWSDLFWSMRDEHPGSYAAGLAAVDAIDVLQGWNDEKVLARLDELDDSDTFFNVKLTYGGHVTARRLGLDAGLDYLSSLRRSVRDPQLRQAIDMRRVELMLDYEDYDDALAEARGLMDAAGDDEQLTAWAEDAVYKLENLVPGRKIPGFVMPFDGAERMFPDPEGPAVLVLEVVLLADQSYQQTYPALQEVLRDFGDDQLGVFTVPLDQRQVTVDAFFEERSRRWPVSGAGAYEAGDVLTLLRIEEVPTRIVMGRDGTIHARLVGHDIAALRDELNTIIENTN